MISMVIMANANRQFKYTDMKNNNNGLIKQTNFNRVSAWIPYWDAQNAIDDFKNISKKVDSIENFAAYFDSDNSLFIPNENDEKLKEIKQISKENNINVYLSVVNDHKNSDGSLTLKDKKVLSDLLSNEESRTKHINNILQVAIDGNYDGVEIDYERIDKDTLNNFILFSEQLYKKLAEKRIELRIVLEPKEIFSTCKFVDGPEYAMMVYNLYDANSEPGPKADQEFISKVIKIMNNVPGKKWLAFATGGFDWEKDNKGISITENDASELVKKYKIKPERDEKSGAMHFEYADEEKINILYGMPIKKLLDFG